MSTNYLLAVLCVRLTFSWIGCTVFTLLKCITDPSAALLHVRQPDCAQLTGVRQLFGLPLCESRYYRAAFLFSLCPLSDGPLTAAPRLVVDYTLFLSSLICRVLRTSFDRSNTSDCSPKVHIRCCSAVAILGSI